MGNLVREGIAGQLPDKARARTELLANMRMVQDNPTCLLEDGGGQPTYIYFFNALREYLAADEKLDELMKTLL